MLPAGMRVREAHAHLFQLGRSLSMVDLSGVASPAEMLELLAERRRETGDGPIFAQGARPEAWDPPGWPGLAQLDRAVGGAVCVAWCFDTHTALVSSAALELAGFDRTTVDPAGGVIGRDAAGELDGVVSENALVALLGQMPEPAERERRGIIRLAVEHLAGMSCTADGLGFVEVHDMLSQPWLPGLLREMDDGGELPLRVVLHPLVDDLVEMAARRASFERDSIVLRGGKIFTDGTLNSRTAWMLEPYSDAGERCPGHPRGVEIMDVDAIRAAIGVCESVGLPIAAHAIGDGAVRNVLDAIEAERPASTVDGLGGARIEHCEFIHPDDVGRFAAMGVIASVQPCHVLYDIEALGRAAPDRLDRVLPLRSLVESGCVPGELMWFGSDTPVVRADPGDSLQFAVRRGRLGASPTIGPNESIQSGAAVRCFGASFRGSVGQ